MKGDNTKCTLCKKKKHCEPVCYACVMGDPSKPTLKDVLNDEERAYIRYAMMMDKTASLKERRESLLAKFEDEK